MNLSEKDMEWLDAMLKEWEENRRLYDALAKEYLQKEPKAREAS